MASFKIALRFLKSNKVQTLLIVLGIAVGVSVQVFVGSLITSLQADLLDSAVGSSPQVTIEPNDNVTTISDWQMIINELNTYSEITDISVSADAPSFLRDGSRTISILVRGFEYQNATAIYNLDEAVYDGTFPQTDDQVMIGKDLAAEVGAGIGDTLMISTPFGTNHTMTISGLFDLKVQAINSLWAMTTLASAQSMFNFGDDVTTIEMKVTDVFAADQLALDIKERLSNQPIEVSNWKEKNESLLSGLQSQSFSSYIIQTFVLASVVIAIGSILAIKVLQRSRQIGILKAMGIKDRDASLIFIYEGTMLGTIGAITGAALGLILIYAFTIFTRQDDGTSILNIRADPMFVLLSTGIAILAATFAAAIPARRSSKLNPIEVIRNG